MTKSTPPVSNAPRESAAAIEAVATAWAARADRGPLSDEEQAELEAWIAQDPRRAGAYARAMAANAYFDRAVALGENFRPTAPALSRPIDRRWLLAGSGAIAAALLGFFGFGALMQRGRITTAKGDVRRVALSEGSAVTLNTDSAVQPLFDEGLRRIDLVRGEALFDVAKDPARPFVVFASDVEVRAIGTSFTVRLHDGGKVGVAVREGIVEVKRSGARTGLRLFAETMTLSQPGSAMTARPISAEALDQAMAWREGRLDLTGLTLAQAAAEFARYSDHRILIDDPAVAALRVTGVYSTSDPNGFARAAALSLGLVTVDEPQAIRIKRAGAS